MKELHALVDFENVQPSLEALAPGFTDVWLFHGPHQAKQAQAFAATAADIEAMAQTLQTKGVVQVQGGVVTYPK